MDYDAPILGWPTACCIIAVTVGLCLYFHLF